MVGGNFMRNEQQFLYDDIDLNSAEVIENDIEKLCAYVRTNVDSNTLFDGLTSFKLGYRSWGKNFDMPKLNNENAIYYIFSMLKIGSSAILLNEKRSELKDLQAKYDKLNREFGGLEYENKTLTAENERLRERLENFTQKEKKFLEERKKLRENNSILQESNKKLRENSFILQENNNKLLKEKSKLEQDYETLMEQFRLLDKQATKNFGILKGKYEEMKMESQRYMKLAENWQNSCIDQAEQIQQLEEKSKKYVLDDSAREKSLKKRRNHTELMKQRVIKQIEQYLWEYYSRHNWKYLERVPVNDIAMLCGCCSDNVRKYVKEIGDTYPSIIGENYKCYQTWYDAGHKFTGGHNMKRVKTKK